jgi:hypothetical protein
MKRNELYQRAKETEWKTYKRIQAFVLGCGLLSFLINWRIGLVGCLWFIWNDAMFTLGNREHTPDEYETGYYPRGLKKMFKSWIFFAFITAVMLWVGFAVPLPIHKW